MGFALERHGGLAIFLNKRAVSVFMALRLRCARAYGSEEGVFSLFTQPYGSEEGVFSLFTQPYGFAFARLGLG
jgi:hypothetical protein